MSLYASATQIALDTAQLIRPPKRISVSDAVAQHVRCKAPNGSWERWDPDTAPYMREPMDLITSRKYKAVIFVGPARTGKTQALIDGALGYTVLCDPSDALVVQMSQLKAAEYGKKRITPMLENSPALRECLSPRGHDNNVTEKIFKAGNYLRIGHPSKTILASSDYRFVFLTDYDRYPEDIGGEGDGFTMGGKRTQTYQSRGMLVVESSPGHEITDASWLPSTAHEAPPSTGILSAYNEGDRRQLYWPCPHCGEYFAARFEYLTWQEHAEARSAAKTVTCRCPHCETPITPEHKPQMLAAVRWVPEGMQLNRDGQLQGTPRESLYASFWMEGPAAAFQSWQELVYNYLVAEAEYQRTDSQEKLRAVMNVDIGRPYLVRTNAERRSAERLMDRAESFGKRTVPDGVRCLFAAVDVQGGKHRRFVVQVVGYGQHGERWLIDRYNIKYSTRSNEDGEALPIDPAGYAEDWELLLSDVAQKTYPLADDSGRRMPIIYTGVDIGGEAGVTDNAYKFWRQAKRLGFGKRIYLLKGASSKSDKLIRKSYPDNTDNKQRNADARGDVPIYLLQTDALKDRLAAALERNEAGANCIHFPNWLGQWFFDELTYEERSADGKWKKPGKGPNEAFDLFSYCHALAILRGIEKVNWQAPPSWCAHWQNNSELLRDEQSKDAPPVAAKAAKSQTSNSWLNIEQDNWL